MCVKVYLQICYYDYNSCIYVIGDVKQYLSFDNDKR